MRKFFLSDAAAVGFIYLLIPYLLLAPIANLTAAPIISHRPVKMAKKAQPLNIIAHIASDAEIESTYLHLRYDGRSTKGKLPRLQTAGDVPVQVRVTDDRIALLSAADRSSRQTGVVEGGTIVYVTAVRNGFYRVYVPNGESGYLPASGVQILSSGHRFGAAVPASITAAQEFAYRIQVIDRNGQSAETEWTPVRLVSAEDIALMQSGKTPSAALTAASPSGAGTPFYRKALFWIFLAATAGGIIYFLSQQEESAEQSDVDVIVEWN
ncbi:MAG TPA: SH3 domain-containing protein [bacterium]|jgi:hypothetical protein|nr:SH3 domain-containing protein [bacterium]HNT65309.1 SH3 domain-containing protein [bacterium]HOX86477.1 SH3 domain-containing protein [bacterium]HPG46503.1 SH3 domain-containing protein [bacterium]HPM98440.1 SH3 domain-containing protein [bacterium]